MAKNIVTNFRARVEAPGFDNNGVARNDLTLVGGLINITSYTNNGEPLTAQDLGLDTIDFLGLDVRTVNDAGTVPASGAIPMAAYDESSELLIVNIDHGADTAVTTGQDATVRFFAVGQSAASTDLT